MQKKTTLSDLKLSLSEIMIDLGKNSSDDVNHSDAIKLLKQSHEKDIKVLTPSLIDVALKRLATEVGRRKTRKGKSGQGGFDLFGVYTGVPNMMSTGKGRAKDFRKATLEEGRAWLATHSGAPSIDPERNKGVEFMIEDLAPYSVTGKETFEELAVLKAKALGKLAEDKE